MASKKQRASSPVPIHACLKAIEVAGDLQKKETHFVIISVDDIGVVESDKRPKQSSPRWEWSGNKFLCHPSSTITIGVYRQSRIPGIKHLVGRHSGKLIELLETGTNFDLTNEDGTMIAPKIKIYLSIEPAAGQEFKTLMESVDANISRIDGTTRNFSGLATVGTALQITKNILDIVSDVHPVFKASWTILSAVYDAVEQVEIQDDSVRELAENLRETLGLAKEHPNLLVVEGTINVIEEIGRMSLKVTSLIYEYTRPKFAGRAVNLQLSTDLKKRIADCQISCTELKEKFKTRVIIETHNVAKEIKDDNVKIRRTLDIVQNNQLAREIWKWLSPPDSSANYHAALEKHQEGTFNWFLDDKWFHEFQEKSGFLWIKGTSGCGKTVLCSTIIDKIIKFHKEKLESVAYGYFFFDARDSQRDLQLHDKLIRSLIRQLAAQCDGIPTVLVNLYGKGYQQPSVHSLQDTLHCIMEGFDSVYIVIDSLDECVERTKTLPWIRQIISEKRDNLHMVVASRPEQDINNALKSLEISSVDLVEEVEEDITKYLDQELQLLTKWDEETRENIKLTLKEGAQGMFRWVSLQLTELQKCSNQSAVLKQLRNLPKGLYETYDRILSKIGRETDSTDTKTFLRLLSFSARPMTLKEIAAAAAIEFDDKNGPRYAPSHQYWDEHDVLLKCSGLITESNNGIVKLAHFSVKEYLLSEHLHSGPISSFYLTSAEHSHSVISQICLAYLLHFDAPNSLDGLNSFPLAQYAAQHWISHSRSADTNFDSATSAMWTLAEKLFGPNGTAAWTNWIRIYDLQSPFKKPDPKRIPPGTALYYASLAGLVPVAQYLLESEQQDANAEGEEYGHALQAASYKGHIEIVQLLLKNGADANAKGGRYDSALQAASHRGHIKIVQLLLENGADVNASGYVPALHSASFRGHTDIVQLLLENGADANLQASEFNSKFHTASYAKRYATIIELLLVEGAEAASRGHAYSNALQAASFQGYTTIVRLLLENGANVNLEGGTYGNALQAASCEGYTTIVELLLEKGADVNLKGGEYNNALQAASYQGRTAIVEILLKNGMDANMAGGKYGSALEAALDQGHQATAEVLLQNGADAQSDGHCNALHVASYQGKDWIVRLLLKHGADVNAHGGYHGSALYAASYGGHEAMVQLLLEEGAHVDIHRGEHSNALRAASAWGYDGIVKLLKEAGQGAASDIVLESPPGPSAV